MLILPASSKEISDRSVPASIHRAHHASSASSRSLTDQRLPSSATQTHQDLESSHPMTSGDPIDQKVDVNSPLSKEEGSQSKSSPSTHRISATSLDEVNLEEVMADDRSARSRSSTVLSRISAGPTGPQSNVPSIQLPKSPTTPSESVPQLPSYGKRPAPIQPPTRKLTSPFSWLSRNISLSSKDPIPSATTPPVHAPNPPSTASPTSNTSAHSGLMLSRISEGHGSNGNFQDPWRSSRANSLRARFKTQRMKEEAGVGLLAEAGGDISKSPLASPTGQSGGYQNGAAITSETMERFEDAKESYPMSPSASVASSTIDPNLAPGTASGISVGPPSRTDSEALADWDLWQALVYEGPIAVAQKSSEELSQAIAAGIPSAIRGVVWQVLANSKNEELERVFERLTSPNLDRNASKKTQVDNLTASTPTEIPDDVVKGRGKSDNEPRDVPPADPVISSELHVSALNVNGNQPPPLPSRENLESLAQFRAPPSPGYDLDVAIPDPSVVQKLEKTIKRDLGARTSFFKYSASAGLQDSLLKVCKAYALFDKTVGYAQGMNFLIMPLLFNVSKPLDVIDF